MAKKKRKKVKKTYDIKSILGNLYFRSFGMIAVGILFALFLFVDSNAPVNGFVKGVLLGLFGIPAIFVPAIFIGVGIYYFNNQKKFAEKIILSLLSLVCISGLFHLCTGTIIPISDAYSTAFCNSFLDCWGGGFFGSIIACPLTYLLHKVVAFIIILILLLVFVSFLIRYSLFAAIFGGIKGIFGAVKESAMDMNSKDDFEKAYERSKNITKNKISSRSMNGSDVIKEAIDFTIDSPNKTSTKKETDFGNGIDVVFEKMDEQNLQTPEEHIENNVEEENFASTETSETPKQKEKNLTQEEIDEYNKEIDENMEVEVKEYIFPDINLLNRKRNSFGDSRQQMYETSNKLISVLENFGVKAKLLQVTQGPAVTRYEIQPNSGVKLSKIVGLADDLALNLAVPTVLVAAVPGKAAVGIEVPNKETAAVTAREMLESDEFTNSKSKLSITLGRDIGGRVVVGDIAKMPHVLIAGSTGSGKSVCINTIITSLLYKASPDEVKLIMVDPKVVELGVYNGIPHLLIPVVTDPKKAAGALNWAVSEMMRRYDIFAQEGVKNLAGYNQVIEQSGKQKLPQIVIIIDELADLMMVAAKEVEDYICRLAQLARAAGIHLIVATQRPTVDVITGLIKANIPTRIAFAVASQIDSRTIIDRGGAEKLLGKGDMLFAPQGCRTPTRVQGAFVSDDEIERLLNFLKAQNADAHYSEDLEEHIERISSGENGVTPDTDDDGDELLPQAIELAVELGQISTAMIQRRLKVGYSRAGRIIDQMEERNIIGPANGSKPRQVYISHADLNVE